jgi:uncharacterized linocin/CFP29 family protein
MERITDFIANGKITGSVAQKLLQSGMNINALRPYIDSEGKHFITVNGKPVMTQNATLMYDEWKTFDDAVVKVARARMNGIADLESRGLVFNIPNGLASTVLQYEDMGDISKASISMDAIVRGKNDRPEYGIKYLPLPIIHKDFQIGARVLAASRKGSMPLDTTMAELAAIKVAEMCETMLFQGSSSYTFGGGTIYGYCDFPHRVQGKLTYPWDSSVATGKTMLADIVAMKAAAIGVKRFGPYVLYIPTDYETVLDEDYTTGYTDMTVRDRILKLSGIEAIKVCDYLTAGSVLLVQMTSDVIRIVNGMPLSPVEWQEEGGMLTHYKVMTIKVPQIREDQNNSCGIVHFTE